MLIDGLPPQEEIERVSQTLKIYTFFKTIRDPADCFKGNPHPSKAARRAYEDLIRVSALPLLGKTGRLLYLGRLLACGPYATLPKKNGFSPVNPGEVLKKHSAAFGELCMVMKSAESPVEVAQWIQTAPIGWDVRVAMTAWVLGIFERRARAAGQAATIVEETMVEATVTVVEAATEPKPEVLRRAAAAGAGS